MCFTTYSPLKFKRILLFIGISSLFQAPLPTQAQRISGDRTLPTPTSVNNVKARIYEITGGSRPQNAANLFHSLQEFSIQSGDTARFVHDAGIQNILTRVTGGSVSNINGTIQTWIDGVKPSTANLFLINPQGIIFGPNAALDIGGSFIGSTADKINFADGREFSAVNPSTKPLLTISVPVGLQFGSNSNGAININGSGNNIKVNPDFSIDTSNRPSGLNYQNSNNQTLALIGNKIILDGGNVTFPSGKVELWSVKQGEVSLVNNNGKLKLEPKAINYSNINLLNSASVNTSGNSGGSIQIKGKDISVENGSVIISDTLGNGSGGEINVSASELLEVKGFVLNPNNQVFSSILADVAPKASGNGGKINIETSSLKIVNGGQISSATFGSGNAGQLNVKAKNIQLDSFSPLGPSGLFTPVAPGGTGNGGTLSLETDRLQITNGARIFSSTFSSGNAGNLQVTAKDIEIFGVSQNGPSGILSVVLSQASGDGGNINIKTESLQIKDGGQISSRTSGRGNAAKLNIAAKNIEITGFSEFAPTAIATDVAPGARGNGGSLSIETDSLKVTNGAQISSSTFGFGKAGDLQLTAKDIELVGIAQNGPSSIVAGVQKIPGAPDFLGTGTGTGGKLNIQTGSLRVRDGAQISVSTSGSGNAGNMQIKADLVELIGSSPRSLSGLFANAVVSNGEGGDLNLISKKLIIRDRATINASNFLSSDPENIRGLAGTGAAGNININSPFILLKNQGTITANTNAGDKGNINIESRNLQIRESSITSNAANSSDGGNIFIKTDTLVGLQNSDITANAAEGFGGRVTINAQGIFGIKERSKLTSESDITASSNRGAEFNGTVQLNTPDIDPNAGVNELPTTVMDVDNQISAGCAAQKGNNFTVSNRGGLPQNPTTTLRGTILWSDLRTAFKREETSNYSVANPKPAIVEATGLVKDKNGEIYLVADNQTGTVTNNQSWNQMPSCSGV